MITPSFGLTATERVLPKLALDFTTASLDPRITFTRTTDATYPATYINSSGILTSATNNQPRFDYNPTTLVCKGLLIEESRTNVLTYSEDFSNAAWSVNTTMGVASGVADPWGGNTAYTLTANGATSVFGRTYTGTASIAYSGTIWIRRRTGTGNINLRIGDNSNINITSSVSSNWSRVSGTATPSTTTVRYYVVLDTSGDAVDIWGSQLEAGAFPTSYIPTTTTALTRNADVATMTGTNFSSWFNASEGAFVADFDTTDVGASRFPNVLVASNGTSAERIFLAVSGGSRRTAVYSSSTSQYDQIGGGLGTTTANAFNRLALGYKVDSFVGAAMGSLATPDVSGVLPTVDRLTLGSSAVSNNFLNGHVAAIRFYPQRLLNAEVQAFSKG